MALTIDYVKESTAEVLKKRFKGHQTAVKTKCVKLNSFREFVLEREPQFNTPEGWEAIKNAWYGRSANIRLTELISEMAKSL